LFGIFHRTTVILLIDLALFQIVSFRSQRTRMIHVHLLVIQPPALSNQGKQTPGSSSYDVYMYPYTLEFINLVIPYTFSPLLLKLYFHSCCIEIGQKCTPGGRKPPLESPEGSHLAFIARLVSSWLDAAINGSKSNDHVKGQPSTTRRTWSGTLQPEIHCPRPCARATVIANAPFLLVPFHPPGPLHHSLQRLDTVKKGPYTALMDDACPM
jgi:hypothetical protein